MKSEFTCVSMSSEAHSLQTQTRASTYFTSTSSISNVSVELGGMLP
jgi:hypothetical protein